MERLQVFAHVDGEMVHDPEFSFDTMEEVLSCLQDSGHLDTNYIIMDMRHATMCQVQRKVTEVKKILMSGGDNE